MKILGLVFLFIFSAFSLSFHFTMDIVENKNILAIQELKNEYTYVGKSENLNHHYIRDTKNIVKEYYINPDLNIELKVNEYLPVYQVFYNYDNSNFIYQLIYNKLLIENEFSNYDMISFNYPSQLIGE